jgi:hypothetical protein
MRKNFKNRTKVINLEKERDKKTIFRKAHNRENPYAQISKRVLRDSRLSAKAMGLMCYFLSLHDDWEISITELVRHFSDGEKSLRSGIKELMLIGYIEIYQSRDDKGFFSSTVFLIHEEPVKVPMGHGSSGVYPYAQNRHAGYRHAGNGALLNTENTKYRIKENNNNNKADIGESINLYQKPVTKIELGNTVNQSNSPSNDFPITQLVENFTDMKTSVPSPLVDLPRAVSTEPNKMDVEPDGSVVVSLMERIKHLAVSRVLVKSWLKKYGFEYVSEKIQLVETQKPNKNPEGFLNKAITNDWKPALPNQSNTSQTKANVIEYPTHNENVTWFNLLADNEKSKCYQMAVNQHWTFGEFLKDQKISVLDSNFTDNSLFKMLMSLIGRAS